MGIVPYYRAWAYARQIVLAEADHRCEVRGCRRRATQVDHIWPRSKGGNDARGNLRAVCAHHNAHKGDRLVPGLLPLFVGDSLERRRQERLIELRDFVELKRKSNFELYRSGMGNVVKSMARFEKEVINVRRMVKDAQDVSEAGISWVFAWRPPKRWMA